MGDEKIVQLNAAWFGEIDPDKVLEGPKGKLKEVLVIGTTTDGESWAASSYRDAEHALWVVEGFRHKMMNGDFT